MTASPGSFHPRVNPEPRLQHTLLRPGGMGVLGMMGDPGSPQGSTAWQLVPERCMAAVGQYR